MITIEKAKPADAAQILAFLKQIGTETDNLTFGPEGLPFSVESEESYLAQLEHSRDDVMFTAKCGGQIIGTASLNRLPRRMGHRGDFSVSVARAFWNQGIGSRLMRAILDFAGENGFEILDLQVRSDNSSAIHLYEKFGFQRAGTHPAFFKIDGQYVDFTYMYLYL